MFDLTRDKTLNRIEQWLDVFKKGLSPEKSEIPIILVGGKLDLQNQKVALQKEAKEITQQYNLYKYIECSYKTAENVGNN